MVPPVLKHGLCSWPAKNENVSRIELASTQIRETLGWNGREELLLGAALFSLADPAKDEWVQRVLKSGSSEVFGGS